MLNTGSVKALQDLQTVGAKRAKLIHAYRELHGKFASFEELSSVPGLTYKYLQSFLKVCGCDVTCMCVLFARNKIECLCRCVTLLCVNL